MSEAGLLLSEPGSDVGDLPLLPEPRRQGRRGDDGGSDQEDAYRDRPQGGEQKFRFCSRSAFLTYPRCPILPRNYLRHIGFDREQIKTAFGKQEKHLDGTLHLHIWITFIRKVDTVNQDTSTQLSEMMRKCKELHTIATYVERTVVDPESAMLSELMSTYASMTVLYLWTLSGLHVCTQPLEIFERSTEIAANGLRTLQSQLCQLRRTPSACLTVMKPTLHSHLVSNVTSGSGDLRPQARPSGLRRTSSVFGTTGWPEPCIPSTTTTANKSSSMMMSSPKRNISSASAIRPPTPDPALDRRDTMCGMSQEI